MDRLVAYLADLTVINGRLFLTILQRSIASAVRRPYCSARTLGTVSVGIFVHNDWSLGKDDDGGDED